MAVYFIQAGGSGGYIKIGVAKSVTKRLSGLQSGSAVSLNLLHCIDGDQEVERQMHDRFRRLRLRGEWFIPGQELLDFCGVPRRKIPVKKRELLERFPSIVQPTDDTGMPDEIVESFERSVLLDPSYATGMEHIGATAEMEIEHARYIRRISAKYGLPILPNLEAYISRFE